jgi:hypothetical protein
VESLVTLGTFTAIEGVDAAESKAIFDDLISRKIIDEKGRRLVFTGQATFPREDLEKLLKMLPPGELQRPIHRALIAAWAGHMMRSDYAKQQFDFFQAALAR